MFSSILRGHIYPSKRIAKLQLFFRLAKHLPQHQMLIKFKIFCSHYNTAYYKMHFFSN